MPVPTPPAVAGPPARARHAWRRHLFLFGPVILCTGAGLFLALRAMPLPGGARLLFAAAVSLNVGLLALSSWSSVLGLALLARPDRKPS